ncbi:FitA-like ribbon-helix-helix domain-containing protein [Arachnia propionica]|uniref:Toxin-antitoxin system antitoxin subunit n=1 Tax=Arachnia propionica TaxID=1750 RepID=A0A3P1WVL7_9ACTN|nr:toxin-antitoxin system antitoxin subunit [Arachnia propionica]RRD49948.1 toxin-antitoxin system antitoxin subunit [Arachnia propionica]
MATLTIRQLNDRTHARLRRRAAQHGRSVEAEVRAILDSAVGQPKENILLSLHAAMSGAGGVDLHPVDRSDLPRTVELT